jgi:hypothetical protein
VGHHAQEKVTLAWIANSLELGTLKMSENLRAEIEANPMLEITGGPEPFDFDAQGNLTGVLAGSLAGVGH